MWDAGIGCPDPGSGWKDCVYPYAPGVRGLGQGLRKSPACWENTRKTGRLSGCARVLRWYSCVSGCGFRKNDVYCIRFSRPSTMINRGECNKKVGVGAILCLGDFEKSRSPYSRSGSMSRGRLHRKCFSLQRCPVTAPAVLSQIP